MNVGQSEIAAGVAVGEPLMIEAQEVQHRGLNVVHVDAVLDDIETQVIRRPVRQPGLDPSAGKPHRVRLRMVVASQAASQGRVRFDHRRAAEFASPDHQRFVQEAALLEIGDQRRRALIGLFAVVGVVSHDIGSASQPSL